MVSARLTSKGRITLPKAVRDRLRLFAGDRVQFLTDCEGRVVLASAAVSIKTLKGMLPSPTLPVSLAEIDQAIGRGAMRHTRQRPKR
jgi:AbrB family looped-hinge helix DNA binding protein